MFVSSFYVLPKWRVFETSTAATIFQRSARVWRSLWNVYEKKKIHYGRFFTLWFKLDGKRWPGKTLQRKSTRHDDIYFGRTYAQATGEEVQWHNLYSIFISNTLLINGDHSFSKLKYRVFITTKGRKLKKCDFSGKWS